MKICFLGDGTEMHLMRWVKAFVKLGHETNVITFNARSSIQNFADYTGSNLHILAKRFTLTDLLSRTLSVPFLLKDLKSLLSELKPDLIHVHSAGGYAWLACLSQFRPYIVTPWGGDILIHAKESSFNRLLTSWALRRASIVHLDGHNTAQVVRELGVRSENIRLTKFGTDIDLFSPGAPSSQFLQRIGVRDELVVTSVRTLTPVHDVQSFIHAAKIVSEKFPQSKFLIVGDGALREELNKLAMTLGLGERMYFIGRVDEPTMAQCLRATAVYVSTSLSESGLAGSTAEAMSCGVPIINTDTGDIRNWISEGESGFIVPIRSPQVIAEKILILLTDAKLRKQFSRHNRDKIVANNNVLTEMRKVEDIYRFVATAQG